MKTEKRNCDFYIKFRQVIKEKYYNNRGNSLRVNNINSKNKCKRVNYSGVWGDFIVIKASTKVQFVFILIIIIITFGLFI